MGVSSPLITVFYTGFPQRRRNNRTRYKEQYDNPLWGRGQGRRGPGLELPGNRMGRAFTSLSMQTVTATSNGTVKLSLQRKLNKNRPRASTSRGKKNSNKNKNPKVQSLRHSVLLTWLQALTTNTADG